ncbi:UNVERIFIED_CONTAM: hypothetical protein Cloal_2908 [Acetivibrio alkalicellulosi]
METSAKVSASKYNNKFKLNDNFMIIDFEANFNNYEEKILNNYKIFNYTCPVCGAKHSLSRHAKYKRYTCILYKNTICFDTIEILRLKCSSCGKTHAILPSNIIPYCVYSYSCIFTVLFVTFF